MTGKPLVEDARNELARFGHHPDPAADFLIEVEQIQAIASERQRSSSQLDSAADVDLCRRLGKALEFRVGGNAKCVNAKAELRTAITACGYSATGDAAFAGQPLRPISPE